MTASDRLLKLGAYCNFGIAFLHLALAFAGERVNRFFGAPRWVLEMIHDGNIWLYVMFFGMVSLFSVLALYALSGAGSFRRLPLLRTVLVFIGVLYTLRGLEVILDVWIIIRTSGGYVQFLVFSVVALCVGIFYLLGTIGNWQSLRPARA